MVIHDGTAFKTYPHGSALNGYRFTVFGVRDVFATPVAWARTGVEDVVDRLTKNVGGAARARAVAVLALVTALDGADKGVIGSTAAQIEKSFHIGTTRIGLLVTVSALVGTIGTVPFGVLADKLKRVPLLALSVLAWGVAEIVGGTSTSFIMLLLTRLALGVLTAAEPPIVASLSGDLFPPSERGRLLGFILGGEVLGTGMGILMANLVSTVAGWRGALIVLAIPSPLLWLALRRLLPEPARGGGSWLGVGEEAIKAADEIGGETVRASTEGSPPRVDTIVLKQVEASGVEPSEEIVPKAEPGEMNLLQVVRYVLKVRTNLVLVVSSSFGYFFLGGLETFGLLYVRGRFGLSQGLATLVVLLIGGGILLGVLSGGRLADSLIKRGRLTARIWVGAFGYLASVLLLAPGLLSAALAVAMPFFIVAAIALSAPNPPLDAARLDVVGSRFWGRAEGVRSVLRSGLQASAPLLFGYIASLLGAGSVSLGTGVNSRHAAVSAAQARGLELTFLVMLVPLAFSGLFLLRAVRSYPVDVASAAEFERSSSGDAVGDL